MKRWLFPLLTIVTIDLPDGSFMGVTQLNLDNVTVVCSTPVVAVPAISTGPYILKATSGDCYKMDYVNPNGTPSKSPLSWVPCPK